MNVKVAEVDESKQTVRFLREWKTYFLHQICEEYDIA